MLISYRGLETRRGYLTKCNFYRRGKKPSSDYCPPYVLGRCTEDASEDGVSVILAPSGTDVQEHILHRFLQLTHFCKFCQIAPSGFQPSIYIWCNRITPHGHWIWIPEATGRRFCRGTFFDTIHLASVADNAASKMGQAEGRPMAIHMAGPQHAPFYLQRCPLHSCQVDRTEKCPSTKSAACGLRNPYPVSVWCNSVTPCIYYFSENSSYFPNSAFVKHNILYAILIYLSTIYTYL